MDKQMCIDPEVDVIALSFATRLLLTDLDRKLIIERAIESLADFGRTDRVGLFLLDPVGQQLIGKGGLISKGKISRPLKIDLEGSLCEEIIESKDTKVFPVTYIDDMPCPTLENGEPGRQCLCAPLVAANNHSIGLVVFDHPKGFVFESILKQTLMVLLTVVAIALETARLFQQAVFDGLTGLYVRRYFDLRLQEEENRIRRYGGKLALLITDIDFFKKFNDTYGHQQGDEVLKETAKLMRECVRESLDAVCRYGGEEFIVIMPDTDLKGATVVAERIRKRCESHPFASEVGPLKVTMSGGLAFMDQATIISGDDLLKKADDCLYKAKENGRNQIQVQDD